jgi:hypothetical protein
MITTIHLSGTAGQAPSDSQNCRSIELPSSEAPLRPPCLKAHSTRQVMSARSNDS